MTYGSTTNYTGANISSIIIDLFGTILVAVIGFGSLIGLVMLYRWVKKK